MNFKKIIGKIVEVDVLDHEQDTSISPKDVHIDKPLNVKVYGKCLAETEEYIVVSSWVCEEENDIYRLIKSCIKNVKVLK